MFLFKGMKFSGSTTVRTAQLIQLVQTGAGVKGYA
ncbi:hypothetical protein NIASO_05755 [Niabella soli DSM 19437]|uniref:Uncharacterized protein n=1 Tax=Niabella soli DSM 19437 TaxID=929713 RepID=W0F2T3_9BACT|nr:hypothetical protein NIASO_05755 [Niabella soli DSM 19437]